MTHSLRNRRKTTKIGKKEPSLLLAVKQCRTELSSTIKMLRRKKER